MRMREKDFLKPAFGASFAPVGPIIGIDKRHQQLRLLPLARAVFCVVASQFSGLLAANYSCPAESHA